ncbi:hypothetical protein [Pseudomonas putida]|uniref:Uncharacterized protein n=1 Tax=Pseudomonas putida TaxID=303 RepID=A0A8I1JKI6_PSEPU|nr:hypothetical protein [Pseudomonas putida]MBI6887212.1 hypothetical protein [Pseudomonas putida]
MSDQEFDVAAFAAQATGTSGISDDAGYDQAVPDALANDVDDYDRQAAIRDQHLAEDADPDADPQAESDPATGRKTVPLGALQEERMRRKQIEDRSRELEAQLGQYQQWHQQQVALQQQQLAAQQQAEIPDFEDDPEGHLNGIKQQMANELGQMRNQLETQQRVAQFSAQLQQDVAAVAPTVTQAEDELRAEVGSHYDEAYSFVHQSIQQQLAQKYPGADPQTLVTVEKAASIQFVRDCAARGESPARAIWNFAQQLGFVPSGQRVPGQERRQAPTSLSNIPAAGRAPDEKGKLSAKDIANMPQEDFDQMFESMRRGSEQWPV